jgi:hypothetical protein
MAMTHTSISPRFGLEYAPASILLRLGRREIFVCRDFRRRFYSVNPIIEVGTGIQAGHIEVLVLRRWLVILSRAPY